MTQNELKALVGRAALDHVPAGSRLRVGTGSTVNCFIDGLAPGEATRGRCRVEQRVEQ